MRMHIYDGSISILSFLNFPSAVKKNSARNWRFYFRIDPN